MVASLKGHFDYSFAVAWHPDGNCFATGNQVCGYHLSVFGSSSEYGITSCATLHYPGTGFDTRVALGGRDAVVHRVQHVFTSV